MEDKLLYAESLIFSADLPDELNAEQVIALVTPEKRQEQVLAAIPDMTVAYDPAAGSYAAMNSAELLASAKITPDDSDPRYAEDLAVDATDKPGASTLEIGLGFGRILTDGEQHGFLLFAVLIAAASGILLLTYIRVVRRRK